jgi:hypothetical protein
MYEQPPPPNTEEAHATREHPQHHRRHPSPPTKRAIAVRPPRVRARYRQSHRRASTFKMNSTSLG